MFFIYFLKVFRTATSQNSGEQLDEVITETTNKLYGVLKSMECQG